MAPQDHAPAAATVSTIIAKIWPSTLFMYAENATRLMFTASRISSIAIKMTITFLRFTKMPNTPIVNRIAPTPR